ncbi:MAG: dihydroorotase [Muribaculaceae bacterium]|nr:dihydroorotase [Muribaculaceae bacterium]
MKQLLYNATIVNEGREYLGYLAIDGDGIIAKIGSGTPSKEMIREYKDTAIDLQTDWLLPGVIDSHVHFREPGGEHKATIFSESRAAVAGGVTSFMEMPNTNPATTTLEALEDKFDRAASDSMANYSFYIGATKENINVLKAVDYTRVPGVKLFMGSSTGGMLVDGDDALCEIFKLPVLIAAHCEDEAIIRANTELVKELYPDSEPEIEWHPQIRNVAACYKSSKHAIELANRFNSSLHIMHISTLQEVKLLAQAKGNITGEACIAHIIFNDDDYTKLGTRIKCNPAIKSQPHRNALVEAISKNVISTISTDHAPHTIEEKNQGLFKAPSGMPMVQFSLLSMIDARRDTNWDITKIVEMMCHNQADLYGIEGRGYIREGYAADLVQVSPRHTTKVDTSTILSKCGWSPLEGRELNSRVERTWVNGALVYTHQYGIIETNRSARPLKFKH